MRGWVVYIPTPSMSIVMSVGSWATSLHARAHAAPGRVQVACAHDLRTRMQFDLGACWTCYIFFCFLFFIFI